MAPHGDAISRTNNKFSKPARDGIQRTVSDTSFFELSKEVMELKSLPPISEVEDAKCECCGMSEECTPEYIDRVRNKFSGKWICGLCTEAVKEEVEKNGGKKEEALTSHMSACAKFKKIRAFPALFQAEAMREILKKSTKAKSFNHRGKVGPNKGGIARSSSCIPAITKEMNDMRMTK